MIRPLLALGVLLTVCQDGRAQQPAGPADRIAAEINQHTFESHFRFLSDDLLEGRGLGTRGGRLAGNYIAAQFERIGLRPAGADSGWFQPFGLTARRTVRSELAVGGERFALGAEQALTILGRDTLKEYMGQAVFVGYGLVVPEYRWDDYKDVNVRGNLVIAIAGHPGQVDSSIFTKPGNYGTRTAKTLEAIRHGAAGVLVIHRPVEAGYAWQQVPRFWFQENVALAAPDTSTSIPSGISGWIRDSAAARLLRSAGLDLATLIARSGSRHFRPIPVPLDLRAAAATRSRFIEGRNVVGLLPGHGAEADQVVVLGGHYDHLGIGSPEAGDSIYNGAEDNANGIGGLLAIAEAFTRANVAPRRSILFVAFDAEESGLLGSEAYVRSPGIPLVRTAAMLNMDGLNVYARTSDTWALGLEYSSLGEVFRNAAREEGLAVEISAREKQFLEDQQFFTRSDHYRFANAGVPSLFMWGGYSAVGRPAGWMQQKLEEYLGTRYHRSSDEMQDWYSYEGTLADLRVLARTLYAVAMAPGSPEWNPGSPYQRK